MSEPKAWVDCETAWLVERKDHQDALGVVDNKIAWTPFDQAVRFARREDAEAVMAALLAWYGSAHVSLMAAQHMWMAT